MLLISTFLGTGSIASAQSALNFDGEVFSTFRYFTEDARFPGQNQSRHSTTIGGRLAFNHRFDNSNLVFELSGQANGATERGYLDAPRAYYQYFGDGYDLLVGSNIVYWGVSESRQVVNIVNQTYSLDNPVDPQRLGQPMINLNIETGLNSTLSFYGLLGFREKDLGTLSNRFRAPFESLEDEATFENSGGRDLDFAMRYQTSLSFPNSSLDLALSYFQGTNRDPLMQRGPLRSSGITLVPYYHELRQLGVELVHSKGDLQLTFEGAFREALDENYFAGIAGAQYTFNDFGPDGGNLIAIGEYLYDDRSEEQSLSLFENDLHLGFRYDANDVAGTNVTGGMYFDFDSQSKIYTLSYSRRLSDSVRFDLSGFFMKADDRSDPLFFVEQDSYIEMELRYFF